MLDRRRRLGAVRYAGTAVLCVLVAFGAAFLVRRAVDHRAGTDPAVASAAQTRSTPTVTTSAHVDATRNRPRSHRAGGSGHSRTELASEFRPGILNVKRQRRKPAHRTSSPASSPATTTPYTPTYQDTTPTSTYSPPSTTSSSGGSSSHGSGTTAIGSGSSGRGSGTTTIG
jgi:hypothetical protein